MGARPVAPIKNKEKIEKMKKVLAASSQRNYFLFILGLNSGLRVSELLELRVKDVRGKRSVERLERKTGKVKYFPLNKETRENINNYISGMLDTDFLFTSRKTGKPLHRDRAYKILKEAAEEAGISEFGTHTLRKTFGYHFYLKHEDAAILQKLFNHSSVSVTLKYIGISQEEIEAGLEDFSL
nr:site-specific integrase [Alkalicoccus daliensis]